MRRRLTISIDGDLHDEVRHRVPDGEVSAWFAEAARRMLADEDDDRLRRAAHTVAGDDDLDDLFSLAADVRRGDAHPDDGATSGAGARVPWSVLRRGGPGTDAGP